MKSVVATLCILAMTLTTPAWGVYDANLSGTVTAAFSYAGAGQPVLVQLSNQPTSHPACNPAFFAIAGDNDPKSTDRMYAHLLLGLATGQPTNIGYDSLGNCANGYIRIYRVG